LALAFPAVHLRLALARHPAFPAKPFAKPKHALAFLTILSRFFFSGYIFPARNHAQILLVLSYSCPPLVSIDITRAYSPRRRLFASLIEAVRTIPFMARGSSSVIAARRFQTKSSCVYLCSNNRFSFMIPGVLLVMSDLSKTQTTGASAAKPKPSAPFCCGTEREVSSLDCPSDCA